MYYLFLTLFLLVCILMTIAILLQSSKGGGLAGAFGGGGNMGSVLGGRGAATFLSTATTYLAVAFFVLAFLLSKFSATADTGAQSIVEEKIGEMNTPASILPPVQESAPAVSSPVTTQDDSTK